MEVIGQWGGLLWYRPDEVREGGERQTDRARERERHTQTETERQTETEKQKPS